MTLKKYRMLGAVSAGSLAVLAGMAALVPAQAQAAEPGQPKACQIGIIADLPVTMEGLRASVPVKINGSDYRFWLDSGAFFSFMPLAKAKELSLPLSDLPYWFRMVGVGGSTSAQVATAKSFTIAANDVKNVQFIVGGSDTGNALLGRNLLAIADTEFDLAHGSVKLIYPKGCDHTLMTYWDKSGSYFAVPLLPGDDPHDHEFGMPVTINGAKLKAEYDSGSPTSVISKDAAIKAGIDLNGPSVRPVSGIGGIGRHLNGGWMVTVDNVSIGNEQILRSRIMVIDGPIVAGGDGPDMLLGADYMLAHHIYVARRQKQIYFTYTGGKPFQGDGVAASDKPLALPTGTHRVDALDNATAPTTADGFARRGAARLSQRDLDGGIADLSDAIRLAPANAAYYKARADAYSDQDKSDLAERDYAKALELDPTDADLLVRRGFSRMAEGDHAGALADAQAAAKVTHSASLDAATLATLFQELGQPLRAITMLNDVIEYHRNDSRLQGLLNNRCWARALANVELDKALDDCNTAVKRSGGAPSILDSRALVYFRMGQYAKAEADYNAVLDKQPKEAWSLYMRGLTREREGRKAEGEADVKAAIALEPKVANRAKKFAITG